MCCQDRGKDVAAVWGEGVAMGGVDFADEPVSAKHAEQTGDFSGTAAFFFCGVGRRIKEEGLQIAIAETVDGEFTARNDFKELGIFRGPRAQSANALVVVEDGLTDAANQLAERNGGIYRGKCVEVAFVGSLGNFGAAVEVGDAFAHGEPVFGSRWIRFGMAKDFEGVGMVDGGFHAQDGALFVVELNGVETCAVFDAHALGAVFEVGNDFALESAVDFTAEEAHDVGRREGGHAVKDEGGIDGGQRGAVLEHDVGGPFGLMGGPVVVHGSVFEHEAVVGIEEPGEFIQSGGPGGMDLLIHEGLGFGGIRQTDETVVTPAIGEPRSIHSAGEPLAAVHADLDGEGRPTLNAGVHEAEDRIDQVMVEGESLAEAGHQLQTFGVSVPVDLEAGARLDRGEHGDEPGFDAVAKSDAAGDGLLVGVRGREVLDGAALFLSRAQGSLAQLRGKALSVGPKVFEQDVVFPEQAFEALDEADGAESPAEDQTVETAQHPGDFVGMICYKVIHGVLLKRKMSQPLSFYFFRDAVSISTKRGFTVAERFGCG